jgi:hypothetical protein
MGGGASATIKAAINYARSRDVVLVAAVGNEHSTNPSYPAALDGVIGVSATDHRGAFAASFSNYGPWVDLAAPGVDVLLAARDAGSDKYVRRSGTSFAAPIVAGVALLARARFPDEDANRIAERLRAGARDAARPGFDNLYGYGIVDALGALGGPRPSPLGAVGDAHEPDRSPDRATALVPGQPVTAGVASPADVDWFSVDVAAAQWLDRTVTPPAPKGASAPLPDRSGYWMLGSGGRVYPFGDAPPVGDPSMAISGSAIVGTGEPAADLEPAPGGQGYRVVDSSGRVFGFGVPTLGGTDRGGLWAGESVTSLSATPTGRGYWLFTTAGRVFPFGDAELLGDMAAVPLNRPVLDSIATPTGLGYYMVASDGGIFNFSDRPLAGSLGDHPPAHPIVAVAALP